MANSKVMQSGRYKAYPEYKDSGAEWLGEIPRGWSILRGKYVFYELKERSTTGAETLLSVSEYFGVKPRSENILEGEHLTRAESLEGYKRCYKNDLVMNIMLAWKRGLGVSKFEGIVSPAYSVFRFKENAYPYYMHNLFRTDLYTGHFKTRSTGVIDSRLRLYPESFFDTDVLLPTYQEQQKIANFLDHETAKIDTLIEKQQRLIELLTEKRQAVISHAVTKGLNPDAPMKDSGVEWLGEVPEHWEVGRLKNVLRIKNGRDYKAVEVETGGYPVYGSGGIFRRSSKYLFDGESVLFGRKGTIDKPLLVSGKFWTVDTMFYSEVFKNAKPEYIHHQATLFPFDMLSTNTALPSMTQEDLLELGFVIPPLSEQVDICQYLKAKLETFSELTSKAQQAIQLMQERRTALISAAVTGKIDVRDWVKPE